MNHIFTIEVEAPDHVSREILAENIRGALTDRIGSQVVFTVNYTPIEDPKAAPKLETCPVPGRRGCQRREDGTCPAIGCPAPKKPGDPGFQWPACSICGSRSLRCGCD